MTHQPVLVATDGSARCDRPLDRAAALASEWQAGLTILHVLQPSPKGQTPDLDVAREIITATLAEGESRFEVRIASGPVPQTIAKVAEETGSCLVVTGVARFNGIGDYLLGTAVDYIVRNADVPVLVVKQRPHGPYKRLLVATDFSDCSRIALTTAAELFPAAELHLVHAYHVPYEAWLKSQDVKDYVHDEAQQELDAFVGDARLPDTVRARVRAELGVGEAGGVICQKLRERDADLVVLGTHGRGGFAHATIGSTAAALLSCVPVDTLMVRPPRR